MPELPEVETMCRGIAPILGGVISRVKDPQCSYRPIQCDPSIADIDARLRGMKIDRIHRLGKRVVIEAGSWALILQPKMTGLVSLDDVPTREHVRLELIVKGAAAPGFVFWDRRGLGTIQLLPKEDLKKRIVDGKLGPDAIAVSEEEFIRRIQTTGRPIKPALLDQKLIAGVGNLYASEMLFAARIHPEIPADEVSRNKMKRLYAEMLRILNTAIEHEGSTLSDGTYRNALNQAGDYQNQHQVYDRADEPCPSCRTSPIVRIVQAQRSTFYCPRCQRK
ncbi:MAG: bifunctional DNA-formamidopyrimidine glycosylase/DNA-(apurinic or apyrimidinic site) lyase [Pirellulales bacterium]